MATKSKDQKEQPKPEPKAAAAPAAPAAIPPAPAPDNPMTLAEFAKASAQTPAAKVAPERDGALVRATRNGFDGHRRRPGDVFRIPRGGKVYPWMEVLEPETPAQEG